MAMNKSEIVSRARTGALTNESAFLLFAVIVFSETVSKYFTKHTTEKLPAQENNFFLCGANLFDFTPVPAAARIRFSRVNQPLADWEAA